MNNSPKPMTLVSIIMFLVFICIIAIFSLYFFHHKYQLALDSIEQKDWGQALVLLDSVSDYKDAKVLRDYVKVNLELEKVSKLELNTNIYQNILTSLEQIPDSYQGCYSEEILLFKNQVYNLLQKE